MQNHLTQMQHKFTTLEPTYNQQNGLPVSPPQTVVIPAGALEPIR
jgi:hypothetical protein